MQLPNPLPTNVLVELLKNTITIKPTISSGTPLAGHIFVLPSIKFQERTPALVKESDR